MIKLRKNCLSYFGINVSQSIIVSYIFFGQRLRWIFGKVVIILSVIATVSCSADRSFSILRRPETKLRIILGKGRPNHLALICFEHSYVNRVDIGKVIDEVSSEKVVPTSFLNQFSDQKTWMIYFESCKKKN